MKSKRHLPPWASQPPLFPTHYSSFALLLDFIFMFAFKTNGTLTNPCPLRPPDWAFSPVWSRGGASWPCARQLLSR